MKEIKLKRGEFQNIYFGSDLHRNHKAEFVWGARGFKSAKEHDDWIDSECARLTENDLLVFLGDTALNSSYEETERFILGIKAKKFWIWGNHASWDYPLYLKTTGLTKEEGYEAYPWSIDIKESKWGFRAGYDPLAQMVFFGQELNLKIDYNSFYCRHMAPFIWDKMKYGVMALCGHSHGNCPELNIDNTENGKILDIGVDNAIKYSQRAFFTYEEVLEIMSKKPVKIRDHHGDAHI